MSDNFNNRNLVISFMVGAFVVSAVLITTYYFNNNEAGAAEIPNGSYTLDFERFEPSNLKFDSDTYMKNGTYETVFGLISNLRTKTFGTSLRVVNEPEKSRSFNQIRMINSGHASSKLTFSREHGANPFRLNKRETESSREQLSQNVVDLTLRLEPSKYISFTLTGAYKMLDYQRNLKYTRDRYKVDFDTSFAVNFIDVTGGMYIELGLFRGLGLGIDTNLNFVRNVTKLGLDNIYVSNSSDLTQIANGTTMETLVENVNFADFKDAGFLIKETIKKLDADKSILSADISLFFDNDNFRIGVNGFANVDLMLRNSLTSYKPMDVGAGGFIGLDLGLISGSLVYKYIIQLNSEDFTHTAMKENRHNLGASVGLNFEKFSVGVGYDMNYYSFNKEYSDFRDSDAISLSVSFSI